MLILLQYLLQAIELYTCVYPYITFIICSQLLWHNLRIIHLTGHKAVQRPLQCAPKIDLPTL